MALLLNVMYIMLVQVIGQKEAAVLGGCRHIQPAGFPW